MIEIRFHGRGGQGAVVASELLAQAAFLEGLYPQSFPFFGVERRGAPVTAYTRIDGRPIQLRTRITAPDVVVVLEPGLFQVVPVTLGLKPEGLLLVNSPKAPEELSTPYAGRRATVDATSIARELKLGSASTPIVNTAVLGAFARASLVVREESVDTAIARFLPTRTEENRRAAHEGFVRARVAAPAQLLEVAA